ncbi:MAG: pseudouridylate synthase [Proteobacteria bacterium]|nr:MAG: pseudouridylate synthase [Pseudomonadota bacterium]
MPDALPAADDAPLAILYRDDHLVAIHKPAGLLVHRTALDRHETRFAVQLLRDQIGQHVWPAHRLDRGTSGVLLFALDADTAGQLGRQFEAQTVAKRYVAVVRGHPPESGLIDHALSRQRDDCEWVDPRAEPAPQAARTAYRRLATIELPIAVDRYPTSRYALLQVDPETGRKHQIRRHLKHISHPIIGDATYGKGQHNRMFAAHFGCRRLLLASTDLWLDHPASGQRLHLHAAPAADFTALLDRFGWCAALQIQTAPL